jgi:DNA-binding transcriptional MocR family regulator
MDLGELFLAVDELQPDQLEQLRDYIDRRQKAATDAIRTALGDSVRWHDPSDDRHAWVEQEAQAIEDAFRGLRPLSEIIIEERGEQL